MEHEAVTLDTLCEVFNVSKNTIRRDLNILTEKGTISKTYGGVIANTANNSLFVSFEERNIKNKMEKEFIGKKAASYVKENDIIFIDSGTTTYQMIEHIKNINNLTVITNNLSALNTMFNYPNINVIAIGGNLIRKTSSFAGIESAAIVKNYNISKCFMAATGVSIVSGLTNSTMPEYELKRSVIQKSNEIFLLADRSKFGISSLLTYCPLEDVDYIISDTNPSREYQEFIKKHNINFVLA
jgi:DeoR family myo-inositol catabolism operon transcriptional repressor